MTDRSPHDRSLPISEERTSEVASTRQTLYPKSSLLASEEPPAPSMNGTHILLSCSGPNGTRHVANTHCCSTSYATSITVVPGCQYRRQLPIVEHDCPLTRRHVVWAPTEEEKRLKYKREPCSPGKGIESSSFTLSSLNYKQILLNTDLTVGASSRNHLRTPTNCLVLYLCLQVYRGKKSVNPSSKIKPNITSFGAIHACDY